MGEGKKTGEKGKKQRQDSRLDARPTLSRGQALRGHDTSLSFPRKRESSPK